MKREPEKSLEINVGELKIVNTIEEIAEMLKHVDPQYNLDDVKRLLNKKQKLKKH